MTHDREPVTRPLHVAPKCWLFLFGNEMKNLIFLKNEHLSKIFTQSINTTTMKYFIGE